MPRSMKALCLAAALAASAGSPMPAAAAMVSWIRIPPGCTFPPEGELTQMPCGDHGTYYFGDGVPPSLPTCLDLRRGTEQPAAYPTPGSPQPVGAWWLPCQNGSCFGHGRQPWVAVLDWDQPHGWSVGEVILETSDRRVDVELFDLEDPAGTLPTWLTGVGDAHVLAQLCALAEQVSDPRAEPPLAVNMSFGRQPSGRGPEACMPGGEGGLECEIRSVLALLHGSHGVLPVAAAGNHGTLLFPAEDANVLSAGALDLARFAAGGVAEPSNETPPGADALVPGYGLYLERPFGGYWPAPPGSSYASAFLAGWIAGILAERPETPVSPGGTWTPVQFGGGFLLAHDGHPVPGSDLLQPDSLLKRALGDEPAACDQQTHGTHAAASRISPPAPPLPALSLPQLVARSNDQQPGAVICVPCHGGNPPGGRGTGGGTGGPLTIDLRSALPLPAEYRLTGLYLRIGDTLHRLDKSSHPGLLGQIELGALDTLAISGLDGLLSPGQQLSLVYTLTDPVHTAFWHIEPVNVHDH